VNDRDEEAFGVLRSFYLPDFFNHWPSSPNVGGLPINLWWSVI